MEAVSASFARVVARATPYFGHVVDDANERWTWSETFLNPEKFHWQYRNTPLSNVEIPLITSVGYIITLYALQRFMRNREALTLKWVSAVHNLFLCLLSLAMVIGVSWGMAGKFMQQGWYRAWFCEIEPDFVKGTTYFWCYIFYLSKIWELIDSYLLALRKKPLIILHVYHHMVMVWVCWCGLHGKWGMSLTISTFMNGSVHVLMYYYYFAATVAKPPSWAKHLTKLQISQFVLGIFLTAWFLTTFFQKPVLRYAGGILPVLEFTPGCTGETWAVLFMASVNFSFLLLFMQFFFKKYSGGSSRRPRDAKKTN